MYSIVKRDEKYLNELINFINENYELNILKIKPAKRGFYGETWQIFTIDNSYFLKYNFSNIKNEYADSFSVMQFFSENNITFTPKIIPTKNGGLYTAFNDGILGIFEWIDGENLETDETKPFEYAMLCQIYSLPKFNSKINIERFEIDVLNVFYGLLDRLKYSDDKNEKLLYKEIIKKADLISFRENQLIKYSKLCKLDMGNFYLTHGDAGGNLLVNDNKKFIIDWDAPKYAPPERDAWFVCVHKLWARDTFNSILKKHNINYELKYERLAFYAYFSYFYYFTEYLTAVFDIKEGKKELINDVISYMKCWIETPLSFADTIT